MFDDGSDVLVVEYDVFFVVGGLGQVDVYVVIEDCVEVIDFVCG